MLADRELLDAVRDAADEYTVHGELGRRGDALAALLASERASGTLVVLMVSSTTDASGAVELSIEVKPELDARIPDGGTACPACGVTLRPWVRFCTRCGHDVTGRGAVSDEERAALRAAVEEAVADDYEFLGAMRRSEGGGDVFFARERASGRIAALRLNRTVGDGEFELGETNILRKAPTPPPRPRAAAGGAPLVSVTQLLRKLDADDPPPPAMVPRSRADVAAGAPRPSVAPVPPSATPASVPRMAPEPEPVPESLPYRIPVDNRTLLIGAVGLVAVLVILAILVLR